MAIKIYFNPMSTHARRVRVTALELGLEIDWKLVDFSKGENTDHAFLAKNPNGKVPVLEDGNFVLWESNAIMQYLADQKPQAGLYPTDAKGRADVNRWLFWEEAHFGHAANTLTWERVLKPTMMKQQPDPTIVATAEQSWTRYAAVLNGQLETRTFVTGSLSIADFALASTLMYREPAAIDTKQYRHLSAWLDRVESRDAWKQTTPKM